MRSRRFPAASSSPTPRTSLAGSRPSRACPPRYGRHRGAKAGPDSSTHSYSPPDRSSASCSARPIPSNSGWCSRRCSPPMSESKVGLRLLSGRPGATAHLHRGARVCARNPAGCGRLVGDRPANLRCRSHRSGEARRPDYERADRPRRAGRDGSRDAADPRCRPASPERCRQRAPPAQAAPARSRTGTPGAAHQAWRSHHDHGSTDRGNDRRIGSDPPSVHRGPYRSRQDHLHR